jgi:hypothetical protein
MLFKTFLKKNQRPSAKPPIAINSSLGTWDAYVWKPTYEEVLKEIPFRRDELELRQKLIEQKIPIYQSAGNEGVKDKDGNFAWNIYASVPKTHVVGGTKRGSQELHPATSSVEFITDTAPFEYKVSYNEKGINLTGGDPDVDGVNFTYAQLGLKTPEAIRAYQNGLPPIIQGNSCATPYVLARKTLREILKFISEHANKVPPLPKALLEQAKRLGMLNRLEELGFLVKPKPSALLARDEPIAF